MTHRFLFASLLVLAACPILAGEIYRCDQEGVTIFSDQPCEADARPLELAGSLSVIPAPDNLEEIARANRDWMEAYRAEQVRLRKARAKARQARETGETRLQPATGYPPAIQHGAVIPWVVHDRPRRQHRGRPDRHEDQAEQHRPAHRGRRATDLSRDRSRRRATDLYR